MTTVEPRTLSSLQTFFAKYVFTTVWIVGFGSGALLTWTQPATSGDDSRLLFLVFWVLGSLFLLRTWGRLKRVRLEDDRLLVSNFLREAAIPLRLVESIDENRWMNDHPVTLHFSEPTAFGRAVTFMPRFRPFGFWRRHPVVLELEMLVRAERRRAELHRLRASPA
jgi:hypothetical protein